VTISLLPTIRHDIKGLVLAAFTPLVVVEKGWKSSIWNSLRDSNLSPLSGQIYGNSHLGKTTFGDENIQKY